MTDTPRSICAYCGAVNGAHMSNCIALKYPDQCLFYYGKVETPIPTGLTFRQALICSVANGLLSNKFSWGYSEDKVVTCITGIADAILKAESDHD